MSAQAVEVGRRLPCSRCDGEGELGKSPKSRIWIRCPECGGEGTVVGPEPTVELEEAKAGGLNG